MRLVWMLEFPNLPQVSNAQVQSIWPMHLRRATQSAFATLRQSSQRPVHQNSARIRGPGAAIQLVLLLLVPASLAFWRVGSKRKHSSQLYDFVEDAMRCFQLGHQRQLNRVRLIAEQDPYCVCV